jgi:hypothetical protein
VIGSVAPASTILVVEGSRIVPRGDVRPSASVRVPLLLVIRSCKFEKLLFLMERVGTVELVAELASGLMILMRWVSKKMFA